MNPCVKYVCALTRYAWEGDTDDVHYVLFPHGDVLFHRHAWVVIQSWHTSLRITWKHIIYCLYYSTSDLGAKIQGKNQILEFCAINQGVKRGGMCVTGFNLVTHMPPLFTPWGSYGKSWLFILQYIQSGSKNTRKESNSWFVGTIYIWDCIYIYILFVNIITYIYSPIYTGGGKLLGMCYSGRIWIVMQI